MMERRRGDRSSDRRSLARALALAVFGIGVGWSATALASENWLSNSSFDQDVWGWRTWYATGGVDMQLSWTDDDADPGATTPGSARVVNSSSVALAGWPLDTWLDCFPIDPALAYQLAASIKIPTGQDTTGVAQMMVLWYSGASCVGIPDLYRGPEVRTEGDWQRAEDPAVVPPGGKQSARIGMVAFKTEEAGSFEARFDDVFFAPEPSAAALQAMALGTLGGVAWAARRRRGSGHHLR